MLLAGLFSGVAHINTAASRSFAHGLTFGIDLAVFTNIIQYAYHKTIKTRSGRPFWGKWGPTIVLIFAALLSCADLVRHLINDAWGTSCMELDSDYSSIGLCKDGQCEPVDEKYSKYCYSRNVMNEFQGGEGFPHLSVYGWVFTIFCTYSGFLCLFVGIFWLINFPAKMRAKWRVLRGRRAAPAQAGAAAVPSARGNGAPLLAGNV